MAQVIKRPEFEFEPGRILHASVIEAFRAKGSNFETWCHANRITPASGRQATFGLSGGPVAKALLARIIAAAKGARVIERDWPGHVKQKEFTIVGSNEADPLSGKISNESPMGNAFLDHKKGDKVSVTTPRSSRSWSSSGSLWLILTAAVVWFEKTTAAGLAILDLKL